MSFCATDKHTIQPDIDRQAPDNGTKSLKCT